MNSRLPLSAVLLAALATLGACAMDQPPANHGPLLDLSAPVGVPHEADLLYYGRPLPATLALPGPGTIYAVRERPGTVVFAQWLGTAFDAKWTIATKIIPDAADRIYFVADRAGARPRAPELFDHADGAVGQYHGMRRVMGPHGAPVMNRNGAEMHENAASPKRRNNGPQHDSDHGDSDHNKGAPPPPAAPPPA